mgnify:CR=1 FL=1
MTDMKIIFVIFFYVVNYLLFFNFINIINKENIIMYKIMNLIECVYFKGATKSPIENIL